MIGVVNPTPGSVSIGKDADDIEIACELDGYLPADARLSSTFKGATLGNILLGGIVGIAIDAGSGAMNEYPTSINVTLVPEAFESDAVRDEYFEAMRRRVVDDYEVSLAEIDQGCKGSKCDKKRDKLTTARDDRLADIEWKRMATVVEGQ